MKSGFTIAILLLAVASNAKADDKFTAALTQSEQVIARADSILADCVAGTPDTGTLESISKDVAAIEDSVTAINSPDNNDAYISRLVSWNLANLKKLVAECKKA
jgi:hypothetical protein